MKWLIDPNTSPTRTPAAPASADPMKNVFTITWSTSIPIIAAASRSNAVARIALPSFVRVTSSQRPAIITKADAITMMRMIQTLSGPQLIPTSTSTRSKVS